MFKYIFLFDFDQILLDFLRPFGSKRPSAERCASAHSKFPVLMPYSDFLINLTLLSSITRL